MAKTLANICILLFCIGAFQSSGVVGKKHHQKQIELTTSAPEPQTEQIATEKPLQTIRFGEKSVVVNYSDEMAFDNGTVSKEISLQNGIRLSLNLEPKEVNMTMVYSSSGMLEISTPDKFVYVLQFEADPENFKVIKFERRSSVLNRASVKNLAAIIG